MNYGLRFLYSLLFVFSSPLLGQVQKHSTMCPVHEAFMTKSADEMILTAIRKAPPQAHEEAAPLSPHQEAVWLPGYWKWSPDNSSFVWISGVWRVPPPGMAWISGKWIETRSGWVWNRGFWYPQDAENFVIIEKAPPAPLDEKVSKAPSKVDFWVKGHWSYDYKKSRFEWFQGKWAERQEKWILTPGRYIAHGGGFVYVPAYWDWRLEDRGEAYPCQWEGDEMKTQMGKPLGMHEILAYYYLYWPDYAAFFEHFSHYYPRWDFGWADYPNWWTWPSWWGLTSEEQWGLWWWWTHPHYPAPHYMNDELANKIVRPGEKILNGINQIHPPFIVTKDGVITQEALYKELLETGVKGEPYVPASDGKREYMYHNLNKQESNRRDIRPTGYLDERELESEIEKPFSGPDKKMHEAPPKRIKVPSVPVVKQLSSQQKPLKMVKQESAPKMTPPKQERQTQHTPQVTNNKSFQSKLEIQQIEEQHTRRLVSNTSITEREQKPVNSSKSGQYYPSFTYAPSVAYAPSPSECCGGDCTKQCYELGCRCPDLKLNTYDLYRGIWAVPTSRLSFFQNCPCNEAKNCYEMKRRASCIKKYDKQRYPGAYWDDYARWAAWHEQWQQYYKEYNEWHQKYQMHCDLQKRHCDLQKRQSFLKNLYWNQKCSSYINEKREVDREQKKECIPQREHRNGLFNLWSKNDKEVPHFEPYYKKASKNDKQKGRIRMTSPKILEKAKS
jgi:hypothetical protein